MLEHLIEKYRDKKDDIKEVVYKLSFAGKFIIVKGKTLCGSLIIISNTFKQFDTTHKRFNAHLYKFLYDHYMKKKNGKFRFRVKVIAKVSRKIDHLQLLKTEQIALDNNIKNPKCLNNSIQAYIPNRNKKTGTYGWIQKEAVIRFKRWLKSKERGLSTNRHTAKLAQAPENCDL